MRKTFLSVLSGIFVALAVTLGLGVIDASRVFAKDDSNVNCHKSDYGPNIGNCVGSKDCTKAEHCDFSAESCACQ
jgi:hypothetical protein